MLLLASACGGTASDEVAQEGVESASTADDATVSETTTRPEPTATSDPIAPADGLLITTSGDARRGVARIELKFPELDCEGTRQFQHAGSGFLIDPSRIMMTNQHVVGVGVGDEVTARIDDEMYTGSVIAASECSDVALAKSDPDVGTRITAVGYPSDEYTTSEGTIVDRSALLFTPECYTRAVEHSATTLPGNSGGPLLTADGVVVGMNSYALANDDDGRENFYAVSPTCSFRTLSSLRPLDMRAMSQ
jgi:S1-C subfamily serine protease